MDVDYNAAKKYLGKEHYYGELVRKFFLFGGVVMLVSLPFFSESIPASPTFSLLSVVAISLAAGLINPLMRSAVLFNILVSVAALVIFEYQTMRLYTEVSLGGEWTFFVINQVLALNFFFATYYGAKSARGFFLKSKFVSP
ncbi:MAG: hypothetical protein UY44_C0001G0061 [Candidatus Kaiserbacteria bacterium GW2011_GWA2_49_19]|uniref:Uncharacterized protein n=1 Tax=Candidatus Kaiserbacteria bacterium GW2011_GWA2_49_19 TaxID=1618669 RepID=A0A0G1VSP7_9BACT|nr:MAG: hypothetical protein UY44_C0001G0061 [Candidatus Kaiserbacteria bacterium GW2011_GWA2_49_19]